MLNVYIEIFYAFSKDNFKIFNFYFVLYTNVSFLVENVYCNSKNNLYFSVVSNLNYFFYYSNKICFVIIYWITLKVDISNLYFYFVYYKVFKFLENYKAICYREDTSVSNFLYFFADKYFRNEDYFRIFISIYSNFYDHLYYIFKDFVSNIF